jgi:hypothetical protein
VAFSKRRARDPWNCARRARGGASGACRIRAPGVRSASNGPLANGPTQRHSSGLTGRGRPALVRVVAEHARQRRVGALVQADDRRRAAAHEKGLQHHLVPRVLVPGARPDRGCRAPRPRRPPHVRAHAFGRTQAVARRIGIQRQAAVEGHQLVDVGRGAELVEPPHEAIPVGSRWSAAAAPAPPGRRVQATGSSRDARARPAASVRGVERQRRLAELARDQADAAEQFAIVAPASSSPRVRSHCDAATSSRASKPAAAVRPRGS